MGLGKKGSPVGNRTRLYMRAQYLQPANRAFRWMGTDTWNFLGVVKKNLITELLRIPQQLRKQPGKSRQLVLKEIKTES